MRRALFALLGLLGCDERPVVVVSVGPVPLAAATLEVSVKLDGDAALDIAPFRLPAGGAGPHTFGVRLPSERRERRLVIGAGALDEGGCLRAAGFGETQFRGEDATLELLLQEAPIARRACDGQTPVILGVLPPQASNKGGAQLAIRGWGFRSDDSRVSVAATVPGQQVWYAKSALVIEVPKNLGVRGRVPIKVQNKDGQLDERVDLFAYFAESLRFARHSYAVGAVPLAMALGDLDGDGSSLELAVANRDDGQINVLSFDGSFMHTSRTLPVGTWPSAVAIGDMDGKERLDLVVANALDNSVIVLLDQGGMWRAQAPLSVGLYPVALALGDFDGDGRTDVAVAKEAGRDVDLLLGGGDGGLRRGTNVRLPKDAAPLALLSADLNGDGAPDLAVLDRSGSLRILLGGGATLLPGPVLRIGREPSAIASADVDGDGRLDLAVASRGDGQVRILLQQHAGAFVEGGTYDVALQPAAIALADLDGDLLPDLATAGAGGVLTVLRNDGGGRFDRPLRETGLGGALSALALGDLNRDGLIDILVLDRSGGRLLVLENRAD